MLISSFNISISATTDIVSDAICFDFKLLSVLSGLSTIYISVKEGTTGLKRNILSKWGLLFSYFCFVLYEYDKIGKVNKMLSRCIYSQVSLSTWNISSYLETLFLQLRLLRFKTNYWIFLYTSSLSWSIDHTPFGFSRTFHVSENSFWNSLEMWIRKISWWSFFNLT